MALHSYFDHFDSRGDRHSHWDLDDLVDSPELFEVERAVLVFALNAFCGFGRVAVQDLVHKMEIANFSWR